MGKAEIMAASKEFWGFSLIVNGHREGPLLAAALASVEEAASPLIARGIPVELILCLDRPDRYTLEVAKVLRKRARLPCRLLRLKHGDLALARNSAVRVARQPWLAFLDGDDLWAANWLEAAMALLLREENPEQLILHPRYNIYFPQPEVLISPDQGELEDALGVLMTDNLWTALSLAHRRVYRRFAYLPNRLQEGFGYEDWNWNLRTVAAGLVHRVVPDTCHFVRRLPMSLSQRSQALGVLVTPLA
ncbi:MAG: glycosyltransferase [Synechococcaceae bacterium WB5_2A_257]|nr:glycosyltransferase [Synechococcaceae bacterium WB5_2A_257]